MQPTLLIADDHQLFAESLCSLLSGSFDIIGIASDGKQLIEMAVRHRPDLIITDVSMPLLNGIDALQTLIRMGLRCKFIVVTMHVDVSIAVVLFRAGASALVVKTSSAEELKEAIGVVQAGGCYMSPQFPSDLVNILAEAARRPPVDKVNELTPRQRELLQLIAEGKTAKEIGSILNISSRTAESYRYQLMNALGIHTTAELVQHAVRIGLVAIKTPDAAEWK